MLTWHQNLGNCMMIQPNRFNRHRTRTRKTVLTKFSPKIFEDSEVHSCFFFFSSSSHPFKPTMEDNHDILVDDKSQKIQQVWNSMNLDQKKDFLRVDFHDLVAHFDSSNLILEKEVMTEAFVYAKNHNTWKVWICCSCNRKFSHCKLHFQHAMEEHVGNLSQELKSIIPLALTSDWDSIICCDTWKPVNTCAAFPILEAQGKQLSFISKKGEKDKHTDEPFHDSTTDRVLSQDWPFSDDSVRAFLLKSIRKMLQTLQAYEFLSADHVSEVTEYALRRLQGQYPGLILSELGLGRTYLCICLLEASELTKVLKFLNELFHYSTSMTTKKNNEIHTFQYTSEVLFDSKERFILEGDLICLHVNEHPNTGDDASETFCLDSDNEDTGQPNSYALSRWMFTDPCKEKVKLWEHLRKVRKDGGKELHQILHKNFQTLNNMCHDRSNSLSYKEALQTISGLLYSELMDRRINTDHLPRSFETILQQQKKELVASSGSMLDTAMLKVIPIVLKNARSMHERNLTSIEPDICDLVTFEDGDGTVHNFLDLADTCIKEEIKRLFKDINLALMANDTILMATLREREKLGRLLNPSAAADYRTIMLPLFKLYIQAKLEKLVDGNATKIPEEAKQEDIAPGAPVCLKRKEVADIAPDVMINTATIIGSGYAPPTQWSSLLSRRYSGDRLGRTINHYGNVGVVLPISIHGFSRNAANQSCTNCWPAPMHSYKDVRAVKYCGADASEPGAGDSDLQAKLDKKIKELSTKLAACQEQLNVCLKRKEVAKMAHVAITNTATTTSSGYAPPTQWSSLLNRRNSGDRLGRTINHYKLPLSIHGFSRNVADRSRADRWSALIHSYNDNKPVKYCGAGASQPEAADSALQPKLDEKDKKIKELSLKLKLANRRFTMVKAHCASLEKQRVERVFNKSPSRPLIYNRKVSTMNQFGVSYSTLGLILPVASLCLDLILTDPDFR